MEPKSPESILSVLEDESEIRWQSVIYDLVRSGKVNPWDIDISDFTNEYLQTLEKLKEMNFRLSGKVILTAAILLKLKTNRIGLDEFLELISEEADDESLPEEIEDLSFGAEYVDTDEEKLLKLAEKMRDSSQSNAFSIEPNLERRRHRKVTVFELVTALRKAIDVDDRRGKRKSIETPKETPPKFEFKKVNIREKILEVYSSILKFLNLQKSNSVPFTKIVPSKEKYDVIWTFIPLLHLANEGKVKLSQKRAFEEINVELIEKDLNFLSKIK